MTAIWLPDDATPVTGEVAGRPVVLRFGDVAAEYAAMATGAIVVDRSARGRMRLSGARAAEVLTGLVTNDVLSLAPGHGQYAAALNPKGKIVADLRVFALEPGGDAQPAFLVDAAPRAAAGWADLVRKYVNPRLAAFQDESARLADVGVFGDQARHIVAQATGLSATALAILPAYGHVAGTIDGQALIVARVPELEVEGYDLFAPAELLPTLWRRLTSAGATAAGLEAYDIARVESGRPEWGIDIDETTIPQEANFDELHAISYTKGCYTGQETVARVHFRGHVNRHLRALRFDGALPPSRAALLDATSKPVGEVRSTALSPRLGPIGVGMVRREVEPGTSIVAQWDGGEVGATVLAVA